MHTLEGRRTLITGGTTGIGFATARRFLDAGARVILTGLHEETLAQARDAFGSEAAVARIDAANVQDQAVLARLVQETFGQLDAAVLNAGIGVFQPLEQWDAASFDRTMDTNLKGPFFLVQALQPLFANPASVVLVGSVNAHIGMAGSSVYSASKAALRSLARTLSGELIARGVRVNTLSPGPVKTPIYRKLGLPQDALAQMEAAILAQQPAGRFAEPLEIAEAAVFLASDASAYMVGSELVVDGGFTTL